MRAWSPNRAGLADGGTGAGGQRSFAAAAWILLLLALGWGPQAAGNITVGSSANPVVSGYSTPFYVIDSDAQVSSSGYNRNVIPLNVSVTFSTTSLTNVSGNFRAQFRLIDQTSGEAIPLVGGVSGVAINSVAQDVTVRFLSSSTREFVVTVAPDVRLDATRLYRVEARIQERELRGSFFVYETRSTVVSSATYKFYHFRGTRAADAPVNVIAELNTVSMTRRWLVETDPQHNQFQATVEFTLYRYDNPAVNLPANPDPVFTRFTLELLSQDDGLITRVETLEQNILFPEGEPVTLDPYHLVGASPFQRPRMQTYTRTLSFRLPAGVQLDAYTKRYGIRVRIAHVERFEGFSPVFVDGNQVATQSFVYQRFAQFSGNLRFGNVNTVLQSVNSVSTTSATLVPPASVQLPINIAGGGGLIPTAPGYTYGGATTVVLLANGDAEIASGHSVIVQSPNNPDASTVAGVRYQRGQITLSSSGAATNQVNVRLPAGMGVTTEQRELSQTGELALPGNVQLSPSMLLADTEYKWYPVESPSLFVAEETKPVVIEVDEIKWMVPQGRFELQPVSASSVYYVREREIAIQAALLNANEVLKPSNALYWRMVSGIDVNPVPFIEPRGEDGSADLTASFTLGGPPAELQFHFPFQSFIVGGSGRIEVVRDRVVPLNSFLDVANVWPTFNISVFADCVNPSCGTGSVQGVALQPAGGRFNFSEEGGLYAEGAIGSGGFAPRWGYIPALNAFAHRIFTPFTQGRVHVPGHFMRGTAIPHSHDLAAANILLSGVSFNTGNLVERPLGTSAQVVSYDVLGLSDYAGLNLRAGSSPLQEGSGRTAMSVLGGGAYGPYELKNRSKYYVRRGGLSGIHDKVVTSPEVVFINGYNFTLLNFGLSFLTNVNIDSRTEGSIKLPNPSDFTLDFERLTFLCNGALDKADIAGGLQTVTARYWASEWDVASMDFVRNPAEECNPGGANAANLRLGVTAYAAHVRDPLEGYLGILPTGNLIPKAKNVDGVDSRLVGPSQVRIRGPRKGTSNSYETYFFTPTSGFYFNVAGDAANNYAFPSAPNSAPANAPPIGFVNVAGKLRVAFFQALEAHLQMPSFRPPGENDPPGDWGSAQLFVANGKWGGGSYFGSNYHDPHNRGYNGTTASQLNNYRTSPDFALQAGQNWLNGAIQFDFPVRWDFATRSLRSTRPVKEDMVVLTTEQRVAYLSAERAEIRFGAQVGLPQINLVNFVINEITDATGIAATVQSVLGNGILSPLTNGFDRINELLSNNPSVHYERLMGAQLDSFANFVYNQLLNAWGTNQWNTNPNTILDSLFDSNVGNSNAWGQVWNRLLPQNQAAQIDSSINAMIQGIDALTDPANGLLRSGGPDASALVRTLVRALIQELAGEIAGNIAGVIAGSSVSELNALIAPYLADAEPSLQDLRTGLLDIRAALVTVRSRLNNGSEWFQQLNAMAVVARDGEFINLHTGIRNELGQYLGGFNATHRFNQANANQVRQRIRAAMFNRLIGTTYTGNLKSSFRQRLFDLNETTNSAIGSSFSVVNEVVKGALTGIFINLDTGFAGVLGSFSGSMATAGINGHAIFQGDSLRQVRIDAKVRWSVPNPSSFSGFLEINQYQSGSNSSGCSDPGVDAAEVIIGAVNVPFDFLSPNMRINASTKFSFEITNGRLVPVGFAGSVVMVSGEVAFEAFAVTDFAVAVAFGKDENYLSAALGLRFNGYKAKGGVFFGKTCSIAPIMMWDMFAAGVLGIPNPTFTGIYVYGEARIPVTEAILGIPATCFFQVNAGMGMGIFVFAEGPTYGARGMLSVSGEAFCVFNIGGEVNFAGMKQGNKFKLKGQGSFYVEIGPCPFCFKGYKTVSMTAETGGGKAKGKKPTSN